MNKPPAAPDKLVGALSSGLAILRYLSRTGAGVGVSQVARDLKLNPSTCFNLLKTLVHEGLAVFDGASKSYALGLGLVELAKGALEQASYTRLVRPHLDAIASKHRVTATLWQRVGGGWGLTEELPAMRMALDALVAPVTVGSYEIQLRAIAREMGLPVD